MANYRFNGVPLVQFNDDLLIDLTQNLTIEWTEGNTFFIKYTIQDGDTGENIAYRLWNDSSLSWIIYFINGIVDPFFDWPLRSDELVEYIKNKYGKFQVYDIHHYVKNGFVVNRNSNDPEVKPVTNFQYEFDKNEEKRKIILPTDAFIEMFLTKWSTEA